MFAQSEASMKRRARRSAKLNLVEFVRPDGYWPSPYSLEQAFELFRWMVATGEPYRERVTWGDLGVRELLSDGGGLSYSAFEPIRNIADLRRRFQLALFSSGGGEAARRWRHDHAIHVDSTVTLPYRHFKPMSAGPASLGLTCEADIQRAVSDLLGTQPGTRIKASLNYVHKRARVVHKVVVAVLPVGFCFRLHYGFNALGPGQIDSEWTYALASTRPGETFSETLSRAIQEMERVKTTPFVENPDYVTKKLKAA